MRTNATHVKSPARQCQARLQIVAGSAAGSLHCCYLQVAADGTSPAHLKCSGKGVCLEHRQGEGGGNAGSNGLQRIRRPIRSKAEGGCVHSLQPGPLPGGVTAAHNCSEVEGLLQWRCQKAAAAAVVAAASSGLLEADMRSMKLGRCLEQRSAPYKFLVHCSAFVPPAGAQAHGLASLCPRSGTLALAAPHFEAPEVQV